ncbi:acireductone dioxygenase [Denitrificimonas sp. JX-1]|uniref:Acireductone dioxygenase n=1 Tax=Denitrificimonas halotolerans TaxID=3098930 RepID=A0ABU5GQP5_9GAMM|nr:acireductone dioxygenase [Denitrificimonas sp. JX-1]MDY7219179.1 acireductone dioxygenase [Denitrificimonas sp. JX-1]
MSQLFVFHRDQPMQAIKLLNHAEDICRTLTQLGIDLEHWEIDSSLTAESSHEEILAAYAADIARVQQRSGFTEVDVMSVAESHPEKDVLRKQERVEHQHSEDEVRFFVSGRGIFYMQLDEHVYGVLCEKGSMLSIPAGTKHWFDMGERPRFTLLRLYTSAKALASELTGSDIAEVYLPLDDLV